MIDDNERTLELPSMIQPRIKRILWLDHRITSICHILVRLNNDFNWKCCSGQSMDTVWRGYKILRDYRLHDEWAQYPSKRPNSIHRLWYHHNECGHHRWNPSNYRYDFVISPRWLVVKTRSLKSLRFDCPIFNLSSSQCLATNCSITLRYQPEPNFQSPCIPIISQTSR